jgi:hypothetical protein
VKEIGLSLDLVGRQSQAEGAVSARLRSEMTAAQ